MAKTKPAYRLVLPLTKIVKPVEPRPKPISQDRLKFINGLWTVLCQAIEEANADLLKGAGYADTNWRLVVHPNEYPPPVVIFQDSTQEGTDG